jgi:hypothetical protein
MSKTSQHLDGIPSGTAGGYARSIVWTGVAAASPEAPFLDTGNKYFNALFVCRVAVRQ